MESLSVIRALTSGLWFAGSKDIAVVTGCKSNAWSNLEAVFFARLSVSTAMCGVTLSQYPNIKIENQAMHKEVLRLLVSKV
jgi:hypothetical protein